MSQTITENQAKIQRVLIGLGIESSLSVVDEWRIVLRERGKCTSLEQAIDLLRDCVHLADEEGTPIVRPSQSGPFIAKILRSRKEKEEESKPKPTSSKNLAEIAEAAQQASMRDPERVKQFINSFDLLCNLEKQNGTFEDHFHARRRHFASADITNKRIRDVSEAYVRTRIQILTTIAEKKARQETISQSEGKL